MVDGVPSTASAFRDECSHLGQDRRHEHVNIYEYK
jgi:hypothetical protein